MSKPKVIAFYLPQFHPTPDNDKWWGKGFTEWTNVGKAKPLFRGHYQPKVPADLGYYDLRLPEVREAQAELAKEAGIYGFCYYHYWFGNGKEELELPFNEVLRLGKPDFPFMLCWANESWHKKFWDKDGKGSSVEILIKQTYPGKEDIINHFNYLLHAFKDRRYIKVENKPLFMIYRPDDVANLNILMTTWHELAKEAGFDGIYFIANLSNAETLHNWQKYFDIGFDAINTIRLWVASSYSDGLITKLKNRIRKNLLKEPRRSNYYKIYHCFVAPEDAYDKVFPTLIPNWDHSPRSGKNGYILYNSTPSLFKKHIAEVLSTVKNKNENENFVFLKSWNEWGEGNYMEPDLKWGKQYIHALRENLLYE